MALAWIKTADDGAFENPSLKWQTRLWFSWLFAGESMQQLPEWATQLWQSGLFKA